MQATCWVLPLLSRPTVRSRTFGQLRAECPHSMSLQPFNKRLIVWKSIWNQSNSAWSVVRPPCTYLLQLLGARGCCAGRLRLGRQLCLCGLLRGLELLQLLKGGEGGRNRRDRQGCRHARRTNNRQANEQTGRVQSTHVQQLCCGRQTARPASVDNKSKQTLRCDRF